MMTLQQIRDWLDEHKHTSAWRRVASLSNVDYSTVARIARGKLENPSLPMAERIVGAMRVVESEDKATA